MFASQAKLAILEALAISVVLTSACTKDDLEKSFVTFCGPKCEPLFDGINDTQKPQDEPSSKDKVVHVMSSREGARFKINTYPALDTNKHFYAESRINVSLFVDTTVKYQRLLGFGTTLTDASCVNFFSLPEERRQDMIKDFFNYDSGIRLNLIQIPIGSTEYSFENYALDSPQSDHVELSSYDLDYRIPIIQEALKASGRNKNRVKIVATATSAPADLKSTKSLTDGGRLRSDSFKQYASYLDAAIKAYQKQGANIWTLILSRSPVSSAEDHNKSFTSSSMEMKPSDVAKLVKSLHSIRSQQNSAASYTLMVLGDRKEYIPWWTDSLFKNEDVEKRIAGVAYTNSHAKPSPYDNLVYARRRYSKKYFMVSESAANAPMKLGNWQYAENYATEIVKNLEYGSVGWIDFNMALNLNSDLTIANKLNADASVIVNSKAATYYRNPMFYAIGHLSRYVTPGSIRVKTTLYNSPRTYKTQHIAFITPDNHLITFIANNNINPMAIEIGYDTITRVQLLLETKSFNTFIMRLT